MTEFDKKLEICGPPADVESLSRAFAFSLYSAFIQFNMTRFTYPDGTFEVTFRWNEK